MAAKKETTKKKDTGKKVETKKKPAVKKVAKVTEEQFPKIVEEINEPAIIETVDLEKFKDEKGEYDLTKATDDEVKNAINQLESDDKIFIVNNEEKPLDVINGDPAVLDKVEPIKEEKEAEKNEPIVVEKKEKKVNKIIKKINQNFGYLWNGQMIDF